MPSGSKPTTETTTDNNAKLALNECLSSFKRIAKVCYDNNVRLIVVTTLCYQTFVEQTTPRGLAEMQACVDSMRTVYPDMEYYNFMDDHRFEEDDFFDSSHLTDVGAEKFTKILKTIIDNN